MPMPNHCGECDKPLTHDKWMCKSCEDKEREKKMVSSNRIGEPMKWLESEKKNK